MTLTSSLGALVLRTMQWVRLPRRVLLRKEDFRIGIDIGSNAIRLVSYHLKQNAELSRLALIDLITGKKVQHAQEVNESHILDAINKLLKTLHYKKASIRICHSATMNNLFVVNIPHKGEQELKQTLFWELGPLLPETVKNYDYDYQLLHHDHKKKQMIVLTGVFEKDLLERIFKVFNGIGKAVDILEPDTLSALDLFLRQSGDTKECVGFLQLGASHSNYVILLPESAPDFLFIPFGGNTLNDRIAGDEEISHLADESFPRGGTGKTTTAINLGSALGVLGKKVLLVDLDPQANLTYSLGINNPDGNMAEVFDDSRTFRSILVEKENMFIAPGSEELTDIEVSIIDEPNRENFLRRYLSKIKNSYGYILIDPPPSLSVLTINALNAADGLLIPLQMEVLTFQGLIQLLSTIEGFKQEFSKSLLVKGIVAVKYDARKKLSGEVLDQIKNYINENIFDTVIRENVRVAEAPSFAMSVLKYAPHSHGSRDYLALANELINLDKTRR